MRRPTDIQIIKHLLNRLKAKDKLLAFYRRGHMGQPSESTFRELERKVYGKTPVEWAEERIEEERCT